MSHKRKTRGSSGLGLGKKIRFVSQLSSARIKIAVIHEILLGLYALQVLRLAIQLINVKSLNARIGFQTIDVGAELLVGAPLIELRTYQSTVVIDGPVVRPRAEYIHVRAHTARIHRGSGICLRGPLRNRRSNLVRRLKSHLLHLGVSHRCIRRRLTGARMRRRIRNSPLVAIKSHRPSAGPRAPFRRGSCRRDPLVRLLHVRPAIGRSKRQRAGLSSLRFRGSFRG